MGRVFRMFAKLLLTLGVMAGPISSLAKDDFLPPERAYRYSARVEGDQLIVTWKIEPGYYLYKKKLGIASTMATVQLGTPAWPKGENHTDEYFGTQEIYRGTIDVPTPIILHGGQPTRIAVELKLQGCADAGLCYPPLTWKTDVAVSAPIVASKPGAAGASPAAPNEGGSLRSLFKSSPSSKFVSGDDEFLPPDEAFRFGAGMERPDAVALTWIIAEGYYLYKDRIQITTDTANVQLGKPLLPAGKRKHDEFFGDTEVYYEVLEATLPIARAAGSSGTLNLKIVYQGCAEGGLCYNPITKTVALELPSTNVASALPIDAQPTTGAPVAEQDRLASVLSGSNLLAALATFFGLGVLLAFTPCVLPMIPILSGIIVGQGEKVTALRGFSLAFTYVQGMALTYAAAGAAFVLAFKQAPQAFFQQPWIIILFSLLFIALALAMFGAYNLQLPSALQTRLTDASNKQK